MSNTSIESGKKKCLVFLVVLLGSFFIFDRLLFHAIISQEKNLFKKTDLSTIFFRKKDFNRNFFKIPKGTYDTLIMGSSRTYRGIHPYYLYKYLDKKAFKIAAAKTRPKFNYFFYKVYKKYAGIPEIVIIGMDYFMFKHETNDPFFRHFFPNTEKKPYKKGISLLLTNKTQIDALLNNILEIFASGNDSQKTVKPPGKKKKPPQIIDPFIGFETRKITTLKRPPRFNTFEYAPYPGLEGIWFFKLLKELEKDGVTVALVFLPSFIGTYESNFQQEAFLADIRQLIKPLKNIHILDYNRPDKFPLDNIDYFQDGGYGKSNSHLSARGAVVLNRMLTKDLKKINTR